MLSEKMIGIVPAKWVNKAEWNGQRGYPEERLPYPVIMRANMGGEGHLKGLDVSVGKKTSLSTQRLLGTRKRQKRWSDVTGAKDEMILLTLSRGHLPPLFSGCCSFPPCLCLRVRERNARGCSSQNSGAITASQRSRNEREQNLPV